MAEKIQKYKDIQGNNIMDKDFSDFITSGGEFKGNLIPVNEPSIGNSTNRLSGLYAKILARINALMVDSTGALDFQFEDGAGMRFERAGIGNGGNPTLRPYSSLKGKMNIGARDYELNKIYTTDVMVATYNTGTTGYNRMTNSYVEQWGEITLSFTNSIQTPQTVINFPVTFPNKVLNISCNVRYASDGAYPSFQASAFGGNTVATNCQAYKINGVAFTGTVIVQWRAIGY